MIQRITFFLLFICSVDALAQVTPQFAAASIRPNNSATVLPILRPIRDGIRATDISLHELICNAYSLCSVAELRIANEPTWVASERFDIEARVDPSEADAFSKFSDMDRVQVLNRMLKALLIDRFKLIVHTENRQLPAYNLVIAKNGIKLKPSQTETPELPNGLLRSTPGHLTAQNLPIGRLAQILTPQVSHIVTDKTGLTARYDFALDWMPDKGSVSEGVDATGPSLFTALEEQLGFRLEATKISVQGLVIDRVEHPSEN